MKLKRMNIASSSKSSSLPPLLVLAANESLVILSPLKYANNPVP